MPALNPEAFRVRWIDGATLLAVGASYGAFALLLARGRPLFPMGDPAIAASLAYESR